MINLVIFGPPGAGKGTQSEHIKKHYKVFHLSTGDLLREAISKETPVGIEAKQYTNSGKLVPDEIVIKIVDNKISELGIDIGILFDGFPRTLNQSLELDKLLKSKDRKINLVISIEVDDDIIIERLAGRRMCQKCNIIYHVISKPPKAQGRCDECGAEIIQRKDDNEEVIKNRLNTYHRDTAPVFDYYNNKGILKPINGELSIEEISRQIDVILMVEM